MIVDALALIIELMVMAEGKEFGVVIIKPLSDALKNGDTIRAVVRSTDKFSPLRCL